MNSNIWGIQNLGIPMSGDTGTYEMLLWTLHYVYDKSRLLLEMQDKKQQGFWFIVLILIHEIVSNPIIKNELDWDD